MGSIIEFLFGLALLGFMLFIMIGIPIAMFSDSKKPRTRKPRKQSSLNYYVKNSSLENFDYYHKSDPGEFFVYFITNKKLGALKVGVGNSGRINQLLESFVEKDEHSPKIGWEVLKIAKFSESGGDYELGKIDGNEAEKRAHYYWRYVLNLPLYLDEHQMGYSRIKKNGQILWISTPGYTETVLANKVCEVSTWRFIQKSPGYLEEVDLSQEYRARELRLLYENHSVLEIPPNYENFKLKKVNHFNPKAIEAKGVQERRIEDKDSKNKVDLAPTRKARKEAAPYTAGGIGIYPCSTASCVWPSSSMFESTKCENCKRLKN